jgi:hypothetical protein
VTGIHRAYRIVNPSSGLFPGVPSAAVVDCGLWGDPHIETRPSVRILPIPACGFRCFRVRSRASHGGCPNEHRKHHERIEGLRKSNTRAKLHRRSGPPKVGLAARRGHGQVTAVSGTSPTLDVTIQEDADPRPIGGGRRCGGRRVRGMFARRNIPCAISSLAGTTSSLLGLVTAHRLRVRRAVSPDQARLTCSSRASKYSRIP